MPDVCAYRFVLPLLVELTISAIYRRRGVLKGGVTWGDAFTTRRRRCMKPRCSVIVSCNLCVATWRHIQHVAATVHQIGMVEFLMWRRVAASVSTNQEKACDISSCRLCWFLTNLFFVSQVAHLNAMYDCVAMILASNLFNWLQT